MFPKRHHLSRVCFEEVRKHAYPIHTPFFSLYLARKTQKCNGFAVVVAKKTVRGIVARNRIKRRISHLLKEALKENIFEFSGIVYAKKEASRCSSEKLKEEIVGALRRAKIRGV